MTTFELAMGGSGVSLAAFIGAAFFWRNIIATILTSIVGLAFSGLGIVLSLNGNLDAKGLVGNFGAMAGGFVCAIGICLYLRWKANQPPEKVATRPIPPPEVQTNEIEISLIGCTHAGTCWQCGKPDAPLRRFRLGRYTVIMFLGAEGLSVDTEIPLCVEHSDFKYQIARWARILASPLSVLAFFVPLIVLDNNFEHYNKTFHGMVLWGSLAFGIGTFIFLKRWAKKVQPFQLCYVSPVKRKMIVEFKDAEIVRRVRAEIESGSKQPLEPHEASEADPPTISKA